LVRLLAAANPSVEVSAPTHAELDIAREGDLRAYLAERGAPPEVVFNAAGFTHVDRCEREPDAAAEGNAHGPAVLAILCAELGAKLVHVSTDYVFPGEGTRPYLEDDPVGPLSAYGLSKLQGERQVLEIDPSALVVRTSWVFGRGRNFLAAILDQALKRCRGEASGPLRVVADQTSRPTYAPDLASALHALVAADARGLYHAAGDGIATWWELARFCLDECGFADTEVQKIPTSELDVLAPRPAWSVLDCGKARELGVEMRSWQDAVREYLNSDDAPAGAPGAGS
jgi:dTDP-4-dehydrorhamnose reductase